MNGKYLYALCRGKKWDEVREFLDSDSNNKDRKLEVVHYREGGDGWTCLHTACWKHPPVDAITTLLDIGEKELVMMITTSRKNTALHLACCKSASFDVVKMLIKFGGKELVVAKDTHGDTALHLLCRHINNHDNAANKIKLMLQVPGTELILMEKNRLGKTPLDLATTNGAPDEIIKALLKPRSIDNDPANTNDDDSNIVPDDHDSDTTITELQNQLQAANQKIADLENEIENQNVLLSEQTANRFQDQSADQKISNLEKKHVLLSEQKAEQEKETAYWRGRVNNLTEICSELKVELQQLRDSTRVSVANIKRECETGDGNDTAPAIQSRSSKRSRVGSTAYIMHSDSKDD